MDDRVDDYQFKLKNQPALKTAQKPATLFAFQLSLLYSFLLFFLSWDFTAQ